MESKRDKQSQCVLNVIVHVCKREREKEIEKEKEKERERERESRHGFSF